MRKMTTTLALAAVLALGGTTALADKHMADPKAAEAQKMIEAAEAAKKKAASVDSEWRDTGKMLKGAQAAFEAGDYDKAIKLARQAEVQGELGYRQGASQRELRIPSYIR